jgi:NitT/TauT family transport system substrate-binding protein
MTKRRQSPSVGLSRRSFVAAVTTALVGLGACNHGPPVRIALHPWPGYEFMRLAWRSGTVSRRSATIVDTSTVQDSLALLAEGRVDGAGLTLDQLLGARASGHDLSAALVFDVSAGADAVLAVPAVLTLGDLRGRRLGVESSTLGAVMVAKLLEAGGLHRGDVTVVDIDEDHVAAWDKGDLDSIITYEPSLARLRSRGLRTLFDSRGLPKLIVDILAIRRSLSERQADGLRELISGHFAIIEKWRISPTDIAYQLASMSAIDVEEVIGTLGGMDFPDAVYNRRYLTPPAIEMTAAANELLRILGNAQTITRRPPMDGLFVTDFLPRTR